MIDIKVPTLKEHDTANARQIASDIKSLKNFDEISQWDKRAAEENDRILSAIKSLEGRIQQLSQDIEQAKRTHDAKPLLARIFASKQEAKRLREEHTRLSNEKSQLEELSDQMQSAVEFTPDSSEDLKEMVKEIRVRKKELQVEKKAVSAQMTQARVEARQEAAKVYPGKYSKWSHRHIRLAKEAALRPHETEKAALERQIISLDQLLAWLERFK